MKMGWGWPGGGVLVSISTLIQSRLTLILLIRKILTCDWLTSKQELPGT